MHKNETPKDYGKRREERARKRRVCKGRRWHVQNRRNRVKGC